MSKSVFAELIVFWFSEILKALRHLVFLGRPNTKYFSIKWPSLIGESRIGVETGFGLAFRCSEGALREAVLRSEATKPNTRGAKRRVLQQQRIRLSSEARPNTRGAKRRVLQQQRIRLSSEARPNTRGAKRRVLQQHTCEAKPPELIYQRNVHGRRLKMVRILDWRVWEPFKGSQVERSETKIRG